jgi:hypothetical protein
MSQQLISLSPDLQRLRDEGYEVEIRSNHLLVHSVPYVNSRCKIAGGVLVSELTLAGNVTTKPGTHIAHFIGDHPCTKDGLEIVQMKNNSQKTTLATDVIIDHSFSNKPDGGYADYHQKMTRYIQIIGDPARAIDPNVDARTFKPMASSGEVSVFAYLDTASSRAGIQAISERLSTQRIAIVGLGGTGAYILDLVAKTPVREIHIFDYDILLQHNAFRSPGAASLEELRQRPAKVQYYRDIYSRMHLGIVPHAIRITESNANELQSFDFVFVCVDKGPARRIIIDSLVASRTAFIDVGMGVQITHETRQLWAICRLTAGTTAKWDHIAARVPMADRQDEDLYTQNIQIADLNALNAALAIIRWKKFSGVYEDIEREHHSTYSTNFNLLTSEETPA